MSTDTRCKVCRKDAAGHPHVFVGGWFYHLSHLPDDIRAQLSVKPHHAGLLGRDA